MNLQDLAAEFPRSAVHWRAQTLTKRGDKALALAYIDARDVMDRLDEVCGVDGWQTEFTETPRGRVICRLGLFTGSASGASEWVWKSDGAGDTDVEGDKGALSDAFKRAAVHWGIGRYLYRLKSPWVPCTTYEAGGKLRWSDWSVDPWSVVDGMQPKPDPLAEMDEFRTACDAAIDAIKAQATLVHLQNYWKQLSANQHAIAADAAVIKAKDARKKELAE